jgi:diadenylate cyclase
MQLDELLANVEDDELLVIEDYIQDSNETPEKILERIRQLSYDDLMSLENICRILGYKSGHNVFDTTVHPKGYRLLSMVPRLPISVVKNITEKFSNFQGILNASIEELDDVEGIGEVRARLIKEGLRRIQDQIFLDTRRLL